MANQLGDVSVRFIGKDNLSDTIKNVKGEINSMKKSLSSVDAANLRKLDKEFESTINSSKSVSKQLSEIKRQINEMNYKGLDGTPTFNKMIAKAKELQSVLDKTKLDIGGGNNGGGLGQLQKLIDQLGGKGNLGGAMSKLGTLGKAGGIGAAVAGIAIATKEFYDYNNEIDKAIRKTQTLTGVTANAARDINASASVIARNFGADVNEEIRTANTLMKTFGITGEEAMDLIQDGFVNGADARGDMLDQLYEYSKYFKEAGLNASNLVAVLIQSQQEGIFNDKGLDTIKEANLRLREMPKATQDAIDAIGLSSSEMSQAIQDGSMTTFDAMKKISEKIQETGNESTKTGQAIADIFGSPGEDAGYDYISMLQDLEGDLDAVKEKCGGINDTMNDQITAERNLQKAWDNLRTACMPIFKWMQKELTGILQTTTKTIDALNDLLGLKSENQSEQIDKTMRDAQAQSDQTRNANIKTFKKKVSEGQRADKELDGAHYGVSFDKGKTYGKNGKYKMSNDGRYYTDGQYYYYTKYGANKTNTIAGFVKKDGGGGGGGNKPTKTTTTKTTTTKTQDPITGSLGANQKELNELQSKLTDGFIPNSSEVQDKIKTLKETIEKQKIELGLQVDPQIEENKKKAEELQKNLENANKKESGLTDYKATTSSFDSAIGTTSPRINQIQEEMNYNDKLIESIKQLIETYNELGDVDSVDRLTQRIQNLSEKQQQLGAEASGIKAANDKVAKTEGNWKDASEAVGQFGSAMSSLGEISASPELNVAGTIAQAVATLSLSFAQAMAKTMTPLGWIAFGATGLATLLSMIASIKGAQSFANGGIITGGSYSGDHLTARVNAGEMILNGSQQRRLFDVLDGKGAIGGAQTMSTVNWKIKGSDLYGTLRNYSKGASISGKNTGIL